MTDQLLGEREKELLSGSGFTRRRAAWVRGAPFPAMVRLERERWSSGRDLVVWFAGPVQDPAAPWDDWDPVYAFSQAGQARRRDSYYAPEETSAFGRDFSVHARQALDADPGALVVGLLDGSLCPGFSGAFEPVGALRDASRLARAHGLDDALHAVRQRAHALLNEERHADAVRFWARVDGFEL